MFFCLVFVMPLCASVYMCLVVTWKRAYLLALVCGVLLCVCHFPIDILGQVLYLIVSIPNLCTLTYLANSPDHDKMSPLRCSILIFIVYHSALCRQSMTIN